MVSTATCGGSRTTRRCPSTPPWARGASSRRDPVASRRRVITVDDSAGYAANRVCDDVFPIVEEVLFEPLIS